MKSERDTNQVQRSPESGEQAHGEARSPAWRAVWRGLELPPPPPPPPGFTARIVARARADRRASLGLPLAPVWARSVAALALVAGIASGVGLGLSLSEAEQEPELSWVSSTLADEYYDGALESTGDLSEEGTAQ